MNRNPLSLLVLVTSLAGIAASCAFVAAESNGNMEEMIQTARSKTDHEAIAMQYDAKAKGLMAQAEEHVRMGKLYLGMELGGSKGPKFAGHCDALAANLRTAAEQNQELAKLHRDLAAQAPQ